MADQVLDLLKKLTLNWQGILQALSQVTQRQTVAGEIAFQHGEKYTPTVDDLRLQLVNDDPDHRIADGFGAHVNDLFYQQGNLLIRTMKAQKAAGLVPNKGNEIMDAAKSGNYSSIRGA